MFLLSLHSVGGFAAGATPVPSGPRHCGHASLGAGVSPGTNVRTKTPTSVCMEIPFGFREESGYHLRWPAQCNKVEVMKRLIATTFLFACLCIPPGLAADETPLVVELWPGKVPEELGTIGPEKVVMS